MLILGIDTSTSAIAVGLTDGAGRVATRSRLDARGHTEHLAPLVAELLGAEGVAPADLTAVVVGTGPGPFTGLRVGMVTGVTMGHALGIPVHGICSLDVLAEQVVAAGPVGDRFVVATDARRREVYWAEYRVDGGAVVRASGPAVDRPAELPDTVRALPTAGRGPVLYPELFGSPVEVLDVDAGVLATLGARGIAAGSSMPVEPLYLRRPDALTTAERARS
ncbi:tRNA (adenosine(37)-N6)-threonylcarbamoyltransferase complex dimerization subunit type 1 TsaB [Oryzobacter sp. R7]|uniref:tRNA (adenosine(37)-N6)-threonylcarbamoyltransferase complex dimerization subunit type 1 TsaB n=1 Tax=Oryzobacter faecalis TaxID=3388656 RepID=UPI00398CCBEE